MIVDEFHAKRLLDRAGVATPQGQVVRTAGEAAQVARAWGGAAAVKALIPSGGRGIAGGVRVCADLREVRQAARSLLGRELLGQRVSALLVEQVVAAERELYAAVVVNATTGLIELMVSLAGGVDVEAAASGLARLAVEPGHVLPVHRVGRWLEGAGLEGVDQGALAETLVRLYRAAADLDALLLEVNPLAVAAGALIALDCKLEVDDNALPRQAELAALQRASLEPRELRAREIGVSFVPLDGDIAVITSGAGLGMATLDLLRREGLAPANFLDTGGGISEALVRAALELVMEPPGVRGALVNLYGGINRMLEAARGIARALEGRPGGRPVVVKILGNQQEEAWALLETVPDVHLVRTVQTEAAVARLRALVG